MTEWTKKDGTKIDVKDMDDDHLANTIAMLERGIEARKSMLSVMKREQDRRKPPTREEVIYAATVKAFYDSLPPAPKTDLYKKKSSRTKLSDRARVEAELQKQMDAQYRLADAAKLRKSEEPAEPPSRFAELDLDEDT